MVLHDCLVSFVPLTPIFDTWLPLRLSINCAIKLKLKDTQLVPFKSISGIFFTTLQQTSRYADVQFKGHKVTVLQDGKTNNVELFSQPS